MLLNLMAALSLASVGAVAGIASDSQSVDDVELIKPNVLVKRDLVMTSTITDGGIAYPVNYLSVDNATFDSVLPVSEVAADDFNQFVYGYGIRPDYLDSEPSAIYWVISFLIENYADFESDMVVYVDGLKADLIEAYPWELDNGVSLLGVEATFNVESSTVFAADYLRLWVSNSDSYASYMQQHQIVSGIASGLTSVQHYAASLVSGFDALALDNGALTNSMAFAFTLLGIGTAVGICKLTFNWITGRHGM